MELYCEDSDPMGSRTARDCVSGNAVRIQPAQWSLLYFPRYVLAFRRSNLSIRWGNLYSHAGATSIAVEIPYRNLRLQLARRTGRSSAATDQELATAAAQHLSLPENEVSTTLRQAAEAIQKKQIRRVEALDLAQNLAGWTREVADPHRVLTAGAQEKTK